VSYDPSTLIMDLYKARKAKLEARKVWLAKAAEVGRCDGYNYPAEGPCFRQSSLEFKHWCPGCRAKEPLYKDWQEKSRKAGAALRAVLREAKELLES